MLHGRNRIVSRVVVAGVVEVTSREEEEGVTTLDTTMAVTIAVFTKAGAVVARTNTTNSCSIRINSTVLDTCPVLPSWTDGCQLYVGNLSWETGWQELKDLFPQCGDVDRAEVAEGTDGRKRGGG
jgi:hypothetical protein